MRAIARLNLLPLFVFLAFLFSCEKPVSFEHLSAKLLSEDKAASEAAARALAGEPLFFSRCAAALAVSEEDSRERFIHVLELAGYPAMEQALDVVRYVRMSGAHFDSFARYFKRSGPAGYAALVRRYGFHSDALESGIDNKDFGIITMAHMDRMDDIARLILVMPDSGTDRLQRLLLHPLGGARLLTAKILCAKGWTPSIEYKDKLKIEVVVYYNHLASLKGCAPSEKALEKASATAKADIDRWVKIENDYPISVEVRSEILNSNGTEKKGAMMPK